METWSEENFSKIVQLPKQTFEIGIFFLALAHCDAQWNCPESKKIWLTIPLLPTCDTFDFNSLQIIFHLIDITD